MTPEEQRIKIAELCEWVRVKPPEGLPWGARPGGKQWYYDHQLPDYTGDLNAIYKARSIIRNNTALRVEYLNQLRRVIGGLVSDFDLLDARAAQHAEAFLKTINKWKD